MFLYVLSFCYIFVYFHMFCFNVFDVFGGSCGAIWTKIGGNQAETIPNLPIYPRALNSYRKTRKIAKEHFRKKTKKVNEYLINEY